MSDAEYVPNRSEFLLNRYAVLAGLRPAWVCEWLERHGWECQAGDTTWRTYSREGLDDVTVPMARHDEIYVGSLSMTLEQLSIVHGYLVTYIVNCMYPHELCPMVMRANYNVMRNIKRRAIASRDSACVTLSKGRLLTREGV